MTENIALKSVSEHISSETKKNIVINLVLNAAIAYATLRSLTELSTWGEHGYGKDLIITGFILSTILGGIFIALFRHKKNKEQVIPVGNEGLSLAWLLPYSPWLAAPWMGILGAAIAAPALLGVLALLGVDTLTPVSYSIIKGVWAGALAAIVVPIAIRQGLREPSQAKA
jgi:hypothetical protein